MWWENWNTTSCFFKKPAYQGVLVRAAEPASEEKFFRIMDVGRSQSQRRARPGGRGGLASASSGAEGGARGPGLAAAEHSFQWS